MNTRRARFTMAASAALGLLLTACSGGDGAGDTAGTGPAPATRVVTDALGTEVTVPVEPQRVVTLHYAATQPTLDMGVIPVGQAEVQPNLVPDDLADEVAQVPVVAARGEPQLEKIALLEPDLILAPNVYEEDVLGQLREIAPTFVIPLRGAADTGDGTIWQQKAAMVADVLGRPEEADRLATEYEARLRQIAQTYAEQINGTTIAVISAYEENNFWVWGADNITGQTLTPLGFTWSGQANAMVAGSRTSEAAASFERINAAVGDADLLFLDSDLRGQVNAFMATLQQTPLYQELPAVTAGHAYVLGKTVIAGYSDAHYTLDMVERALQDMAKG